VKDTVRASRQSQTIYSLGSLVRPPLSLLLIFSCHAATSCDDDDDAGAEFRAAVSERIMARLVY
jgi:hypothetical protein